ncbi:MAG: NADH-quinone oxidoreductase subunit A [Phycisphaerales bacterium]|jgi:NADH-quinone oxidoreductase subunit A|nr:NADH-quinone oxidoreductase subunit A [Phycisphaerales bacterium]
MISILAQQAAQSPSAWLPVVLLIIIGVGFAAANLILSILIGPHRTGSVKETTYESGMMPIGDARRRFNVRFYIVAMIFLVFDVEIVFFYPWATLFPHELVAHTSMGLQLLIEAIVFVGLLLVAYFYAWGKGVFRWD